MKFKIHLTHLCEVNSWRIVEADSLADLLDQVQEMSTGDRNADYEVVGDLETRKINIERVAE